MKRLLILVLLAGAGYKGYQHFMPSNNGAYDEMGKPRVVLFVHNGCGKPCDDATKLLSHRDVEFDSINVDEGDEQIEQWKKYGSVRQMPYMVTGNTRVIGYNKWEMVIALAKNFDDTYLTLSEADILNKNFNDDGTPKLVMYTMDGCGYCDQARKYLIDESIPFEERNTSNDYVAKKELDKLGTGTPLIFYGYDRFVGWGENVRRGVLKLL